MSFMLVQSMTILRHKGYETFLILHIVFAIVVVYALFRSVLPTTTFFPLYANINTDPEIDILASTARNGTGISGR
jgi:hypothetical protein